MTRRSAAVGPGNSGIVQEVKIGLLKQHARRKAGIILVERGLEGKAAGRREEANQHGDRTAVKIKSAQIKPAGSRRARQHRAKPGLRIGVAGERGARASFPAARLELKEGIEPRVERLALLPAAKGRR